MKNGNGGQEPHMFKYFYLRLMLGLLFVCGLPLLLLPAWRHLLPQGQLYESWNVLLVGFGFVATMLSLRKMNWFPGTRSVLASIPVLLGWYSVLLGVLFLSRMSYSIPYLTIGFTLSLLWLMVQAYMLRRAHRMTLAYVPMGRADHVEGIEGVNWYRLEEPRMPQGVRIDAIVADLHTPHMPDEWQKFLAECALQHRLVYNIRQAEESLTGRIKIQHMYENNLGSLLPSPLYMWIKYLLESELIILSFPITLPIMLVTAILIKLEDGGSIFFNQERVGYRGKPFLMYKFRSMTENQSVNQQQTTSHGDKRITRIGRFIRKVRIDELPQFFNVLKGDMALIGPRAEYKKFADELSEQVPFYMYRHIVKPGITGWAQVMHGYATGADETQVKIEHDFYYIKYFSLWLDVVIVFKTIRTMLTGFGAR